MPRSRQRSLLPKMLWLNRQKAFSPAGALTLNTVASHSYPYEHDGHAIKKIMLCNCAPAIRLVNVWCRYEL